VYKLPLVKLEVEDLAGQRMSYRLPPAQAAAGFILNPIISNESDYLCFTAGVAKKQVRALTLVVPKEDESFFRSEATIKLFELPPAPEMGGTCEDSRVHFWMFNTYPEHYKTPHPPKYVRIGGKDAVQMHAPSEMVFTVPSGAKTVTGLFGYVPRAYQVSNYTDGAVFRILWSNGSENVDLFQRRLDPLHLAADRGMQEFSVDLTRFSGGELIFKVDPGVNTSWDWTSWAEIKIE
jgi:hypothetical protein